MSKNSKIAKSEPSKCTFGETKATDIVRSLCPSFSKPPTKSVVVYCSACLQFHSSHFFILTWGQARLGLDSRLPRGLVCGMRTLSEIERKIHSRNILLPEIGESGQLKLLESRVLIIGLGGLDSPALLYLAAAGVGNIGAADCDVVDFSNLQPQILHGRKDVGRDKTESAADTIDALLFL